MELLKFSILALPCRLRVPGRRVRGHWSPSEGLLLNSEPLQEAVLQLDYASILGVFVHDACDLCEDSAAQVADVRIP